MDEGMSATIVVDQRIDGERIGESVDSQSAVTDTDFQQSLSDVELRSWLR